MAPLPRSFYARDTVTVARDLLGKTIELGERAGRIVEVEAYLGDGDLAAHSAKGITPRTKVIFGPPGHAYVYLIYGMYECLNIVAEPEGKPGCVLIRALEPLREITAPMNGPGKLTRALGITRTQHYGTDLTRGPLRVLEGSNVEFEIETSLRIGIRVCVDWPLRFFVKDNPYISRRVPVLTQK